VATFGLKGQHLEIKCHQAVEMAKENCISAGQSLPPIDFEAGRFKKKNPRRRPMENIPLGRHFANDGHFSLKILRHLNSGRSHSNKEILFHFEKCAS
jgi:hypothetical protein